MRSRDGCASASRRAAPVSAMAAALAVANAALGRAMLLPGPAVPPSS